MSGRERWTFQEGGPELWQRQQRGRGGRHSENVSWNTEQDRSQEKLATGAAVPGAPPPPVLAGVMVFYSFARSEVGLMINSLWQMGKLRQSEVKSFISLSDFS